MQATMREAGLHLSAVERLVFAERREFSEAKRFERSSVTKREFHFWTQPVSYGDKVTNRGFFVGATLRSTPCKDASGFALDIEVFR